MASKPKKNDAVVASASTSIEVATTPPLATHTTLPPSVGVVSSQTSQTPIDVFEPEIIAVRHELRQALDRFAAFNSAHEGFAKLNEEFDELKEHVWTNETKRDIPKMYAEAIQVAAMGIRFAFEICNEKRGRR